MPDRNQSGERLWRTLAIGLWILIAIIAVGRVALYESPRHVGIYPWFAQAGSDWLAGRPLYLNDPQSHGFRYSPIVAAMFGPLSLLPGPVGSALVRVVSLAALLLGLSLVGFRGAAAGAQSDAACGAVRICDSAVVLRRN
jgi:hypothetical protein